MSELSDLLKAKIRDIQDWPDPEVTFRDIDPVLRDPTLLGECRDVLVDKSRALYSGMIDLVAAPDARGFLLASAIAIERGAGVLMIRKKGKLPPPTESIDYELEYGGKSTLEIGKGSLEGNNVLLFDDVLATGGTIIAARELITRLGGNVVGCGFIVALSYLHGMQRLEEAEIPYYYLVRY